MCGEIQRPARGGGAGAGPRGEPGVLYASESAFVCPGWYHKIPQTERLMNNKRLCLTLLEAGVGDRGRSVGPRGHDLWGLFATRALVPFTRAPLH